MRLALRIAAVAVYGVTSALGQSAKPLEFEVASVKTNQSGQREGGINVIGGGRFRTTNIPFKILLATAYDLPFDQISGGPDWLDSERYDIEAKPDRLATTQQIHLMLQKLLADRFGLVLRRETREMPILALLGDRGSSKLRVHDGPEVDFGIRPGDKGQIVFTGVTMPRFTQFLSIRLSKTVVDKTGWLECTTLSLLGRRMSLNATRALSTFRSPILQELVSSRLCASKLGLKLVSEKGPVEFLNITHVERPSEN